MSEFATSETTAKLDAALAMAQSKIEVATATKPNEAYKRGGKASKYAGLEDIWNAARPALAEQGITLTQWPIHSEDNRLHLVTRVAKDGEWIRCEFSMPLSKQDPQGYGSGITYSRRYCLAAALGIVVDEDDDGNAASNVTSSAHKKPEKYGAIYKNTSLVHPATPPGKTGDGPSAYSVKETPLWSEVGKQSSLDELDGWYCKEETQDLKAKMPWAHQVEIFERFIKQAYDVADSKKALKVFLDGYDTELSDLEAVDPERFSVLMTYAQDAKTKFSPVDAG